MILLIISLFLGLFGFLLGQGIGNEFIATILGIGGIISPILFVLEKIYKVNIKNDFNKNVTCKDLEDLKNLNILTDSEYERAASKVLHREEKERNTIEFNKRATTLNKLLQYEIISEKEFSDKIETLKSFYNINN